MMITLYDLICTLFAALFLGLWYGERGRRLAAERWKVYGTPEGPVPATVSAPTDAAEGAAPTASQEAISRGAKELEAMMSAEGFTYSPAEYQAMAKSMLAEAARR